MYLFLHTTSNTWWLQVAVALDRAAAAQVAIQLAQYRC
jgi:hypothetical protein